MNRKQLSKAEKILQIISLVAIVLAALALLMPLYWMITGSFKILSDTMEIPPEWFPKSPTIKNYIALFSENPTVRWVFNSIIMSGVISLGAMVTSSMAGYAFGKKRFPGHKVLFWLVIMALMLPNQVLVIPLYLEMANFGWIDTYAGLIAPFIAYPLGVFLIRQFMGSVPNEMIDAAKIDGAGEIRVFLTVIVPMARPAIGAVGIFAFVFGWNEYLWQLVITNDESMLTLPVGVSKLAHGMVSLDLGLAMAGATVAFIPMLIFFLFFQKFFIKGITVGSLKG